jgi:hypothetical protein
MIANKKEFFGGVGMLAAFFAVLVIMFMPVFKGKNGLEFLDDLYNTISKGSAYYIPKVQKESDNFFGNTVSLTLKMENETQAKQTASLFSYGDASVSTLGTQLKVAGDLGKILGNCLVDAEEMYRNHGQAVADKYGYDERRVLLNWWKACKAMDKDLKKQGRFSEAKIVATVGKKAVETSYNYYRVDPQKIGARLGLVVFSLVFYVVYTLWYGFGIMFMFEGWGLKLEH